MIDCTLMIGESGLGAIEVSPAMLHPGPISTVGDLAVVERGNQWPRILVPSNEIRSKLPCFPVTFVDLTAAGAGRTHAGCFHGATVVETSTDPAVAAERDAIDELHPALSTANKHASETRYQDLRRGRRSSVWLWSALVRASIIDGLLEMLQWTVRMVVASRISTWPRQRLLTIPSPRVPEKSRIVRLVRCGDGRPGVSKPHAGSGVAGAASRRSRNSASASARSRVRRIGGSALTRSHR